MDFRAMAEKFANEELDLFGECSLIDKVEALLRAAYSQAIEDAAKIAEEHAKDLTNDSASRYLNDIPQETANRIRELNPPSEK